MAAVLPLQDERDRAIKGRRVDEPKIDVDDDPNGMELEESPDGGYIVHENEEEKRDPGEFDANLADALDTAELSALGLDLIRRVEHDKDARRRRDEQYEEGLRRTGLGEDAPGGASFTGASKVTHPMITEACVDFHASAMKELFPPDGPARMKITGSQTPEQLKIADRQKRYMNWQLTKQIPEYADELGVTLTQLPMGGSQYMKFWPDDQEARPRCEFVPIDDLLLPYACNYFWTAHRITHVQRLTDFEYEERVESGMYRETELNAPAETPEPTRAGKASERIEGKDPAAENIDGLRIVYEINTYAKLSIDGNKRLPYLITIDERTNQIVAIYRNWDEKDRRCKRLHWIVDFNFIPWRGAYKMGIAQMIGGLSAAATGSLRALLDSALVQTIPVLAKLKGAKFGAQQKTVDPMQITEIEAGTTVDDIRKVLMALPFNQPSPVLYALLGWLTDTAKGVVTTAEEKIADASNQMPVGTALALMESGAKVFSTIHGGLHRSQAKALEILAYINKRYGVDEQGQAEEFGEIICTQRDFEQPLGVIPVSDPNIFSEGQRYAQMQMVMANAQGVDPKTGQPTALGALHNLYECTRRSYELAKIPNIDEILPPPKKPTELNSAAENSAVMLGMPIQAFPDQDHLAHLESHVRFIVDPMFGGNPAAVPMSYPQMAEHIKQHLAMLYAKEMYEIASESLGTDVSTLLEDQQNWQKADKLLAAASRVVHEKMQHVLQPLGPVLNEIIQKVEAMKPPPPMDPGSASIQIAKMEDARERDRMKQEGTLKGGDLQHKVQKDTKVLEQGDRKLDIQAADVAAKHGLAAEKLENDRAQHEDQHTLAVAEHLSGQEDQAHQHELERRGAEREDQAAVHGQTMDHRAAAREDAAAEHGQMMDHRAAERDDRAQAHNERLDVGDQRLREAEHANSVDMGRAELDIKRGDQAHGQAMDVMGHVAQTHNDEHNRRMSEADLGQRQQEHRDNVREQQASRKEESARHEKDLQAREKEAKARAAQKPKPKGGGKKK